MDEQDRQDFCIYIERLLTVSTVLYRYNNPVYPCLNPYRRARRFTLTQVALQART